MGKPIISNRGTAVDFDLFNVKATIAAAPKTDNVIKREKFVNKKRRRSVANKIERMTQTKALEEKNFDAVMAEQPVVVETTPEANVIESTVTESTETVTRRRRVAP